MSSYAAKSRSDAATGTAKSEPVPLSAVAEQATVKDASDLAIARKSEKPQKHKGSETRNAERRGGIVVGRAPALQAGGQGFDSLNLHHIWANSSAG